MQPPEEFIDIDATPGDPRVIVARLDADVVDPLKEMARARGMSAYMKRQFQYMGIQTPRRRELTRPLMQELKGTSPAQLIKLANDLWEMPEREYQYVAVDLLDKYRSVFEPRHIAGLLKLAQKKSWWDSVDGLATIVGSIVRQHRAADATVHSLMDGAVKHKNLWVRRIAMIHQRNWREETDAKRLFAYARSLAPEKDFFIRKAIGWALREYAKHDPKAVYKFVDQMGVQLSPLSRREATKHRAP